MTSTSSGAWDQFRTRTDPLFPPLVEDGPLAPGDTFDRLRLMGQAIHDVRDPFKKLYVQGLWMDYLMNTRTLGTGTYRQAELMVDAAVKSGNGTGATMTVADSAIQPIRLDAFLAQAPTDAPACEWLVPGLLPRDGIPLIAGMPKAGKTTFAMAGGLAVATGLPFLGLKTTQTPVLWCNLETSEGLARYKLRQFVGEARPEDTFHIVSGTRADLTTTRIRHWIEKLGAGLVVIDSLSKWWTVEDEHQGAQAEQAMDPALQLARTTGACVWLIYHTRKSRQPGNTPMDLIRGSSAIGAAVDLGMVLTKRAGNVRRLEAEGRYDDIVPDRTIELDGVTYRMLDDTRDVHSREGRDHVVAVLDPHTPTTVREVGDLLRDAGTPMSRTSLRRRLEELEHAGDVVRGARQGTAETYLLPARP